MELLQKFKSSKKIINAVELDGVYLSFIYLGLNSTLTIDYNINKKYSFIVDRSIYVYDTLEEAESAFLNCLIDYLGDEIINEIKNY